MLLPREHGAYGQIALPLVTAFAVAGVSTAGLLLALAALAGFLAHESATIVIGLRGPRARRELGAYAARWLWCCVATGIAAGLVAAVLLEPAVRWSLAVPAVPALLLIVSMVRGREKSWYGETAAVLAFAGVSVPVAMASGASMQVASGIAVPFALLFITTTLAVRVVILRVRGGGDPRATEATRRATLTICAAASAVMSAIACFGWLPPSVLVAASPGMLTAAIVALRPPSAAHLRSLGWSLVGVSLLTAVIVIATV